MPYSGGYPSASELKFARGRYDFAVDGGAVGDIVLTSDKIPANAYIVYSLIEVETALTSGGSATVALKSEAAADLLAATAFGSAPWVSTGRKSGIPVSTGATTVKTTAARDLVATVAVAALTGGVFDVVVGYFIVND